LGASANNIVNTSYVSYNPLARSRFATTWTSVIGTETLEGYWTITNDGVGKYIEHQGEIPTAGYVLQRAVYVLSKGQGSNADTYTQPAAVQPIVGDSLNTTLALIQEYMNRVGTDSSYTFLITYKEIQNLLLDIYTGAAAAYSLRKLDKDYTGYAIRVRESAGNTLADIGFDSNGDLDTTALLNHTGPASGYVQTWYDQSGNGNNATQGTNADQPQIVSSGSVILKNGLPALDFNGTSNHMSATGLATTQPTTASFVATSDGYGGYFFDGDDSTDRQAAFISGSQYSAYAGSTQYSGTTIVAGLQINMFIVFNSTSSKIYVNNSGASSLNLGTRVLSGLDIGQRFSDTERLNGQYQELIFWNANQSSNRTGIESNINDYYSIY
jgi:hypothetical protein